MSLTWKLYNARNELVAATRWPDDMAMLVAARYIVGDAVKRNGVLVERFTTTARLAEIADSYDLAIGQWETAYLNKMRAKLERLRERAKAAGATL